LLEALIFHAFSDRNESQQTTLKPLHSMNNVQTEQYYQTSGAEFNGGDELSASSSLCHLFEHLGQIFGEV